MVAGARVLRGDRTGAFESAAEAKTEGGGGGTGGWFAFRTGSSCDAWRRVDVREWEKHSRHVVAVGGL